MILEFNFFLCCYIVPQKPCTSMLIKAPLTMSKSCTVNACYYMMLNIPKHGFIHLGSQGRAKILLPDFKHTLVYLDFSAILNSLSQWTREENVFKTKKSHQKSALFALVFHHFNHKEHCLDNN